MTAEQEKKLSAMTPRDEISRGGYAAACIANTAESRLAHVPIRERTAALQARMLERMQNMQQLEELAALLEKHPEVARILDLMEALRP